MSGTSSKTTRVSIRLPNEIVEIIRRRVDNGHGSISGYLRERIIYDMTRKHKRGKSTSSQYLPDFTKSKIKGITD